MANTKETNTKAVDPQKAVDAAPAPMGIEPAEKGKYVVVQEFRDIVDFSKVHAVGDNVSSFDKKRLAELVQQGLVEQK